MEEIKLLSSDDVIEQIKDFPRWYYLSDEQKLLIDKLMPDKELKKCYKENGLCEECKQPKTDYDWCQSCNAKRFQQNFKNWSSRNDDVDKFIQKAQLNAKNNKEVLEWIEHDRFENIEYLAKGGFGTVFKAIWKDGPIDEWDSENNQYKRWGDIQVALKCLYNSHDTMAEFLGEVSYSFIVLTLIMNDKLTIAHHHYISG